LHQRDDYLRFLGHGKAILRIVKPFVVCIEMHFGVFVFLITVSQRGVRASMSDSLPLSANGKLLPRAGENLANIDLVVIAFPIFVVHPPVSIVFELVVQFLS